jgi:hypothetical protein
VEDSDTAMVQTKKVLTGQWNYRTVCGQVYAETIRELMNGVDGNDDDDDDAEDAASSTNQTSTRRIVSYQRCLSDVWEGLLDMEQQQLRDKAKVWNEQGSPLIVQ